MVDSIKVNVLFRLGMDFRLVTEDRRVLEQIIFPYVAGRSDLRSILFVGCEIYTLGYRRIFRDKDYQTLDVNPSHRRYGAKRHITDGFERIGLHYGEATLDAVICNGVFGWGLDDPAAVDASVAGTWKSLRPGGVFIIGWNDIPARRPFDFRRCPSLGLFFAYRFPPLDSSEYLTATGSRHTYNFFVK